MSSIPPAYFRRHTRPKEPRDLAQHDCLLYFSQPSYDKWWFTDGKRRYGVAVKGHFRANDWAAIYEAAQNGLGIARILAFEAQARAADKLQILFEKETWCDRAIWAVYPRAQATPRKVTAFLNFLAAELAGA